MLRAFGFKWVIDFNNSQKIINELVSARMLSKLSCGFAFLGLSVHPESFFAPILLVKLP